MGKDGDEILYWMVKGACLICAKPWGKYAPQLAGASERPWARQSRLDPELSRAFRQES